MTVKEVAEWPRPLRMLTHVQSEDVEEASKLKQAMTVRDWQAFLFLAVERHRVAPLVQLKLADLEPPEFVLEHLDEAVHTNALQVLLQVAALRSVRNAFSERKLAFAVLKGWPLAEQLFDNNSARQARDIDLLIAPSLIQPAAEALIELGFVPDQQHPEQFRMLGSPALMDEFNNLSFTNSDTNLTIELHWRCHQFTGWPKLFDDGQNLEKLETSIGALTVPSEQTNLIYLAIHGSMHRWARLKWLCDIAELARRRGSVQLEHDVATAKESGASRPLELGLYLAGLILGSPCPTTRFTQNSWLPRQCLGEIARPEAIPGSIAHRLKFYAMMMSLAEGPAQTLGVFRYRVWGKNRLAVADLRRAA